MHKLLREIPSVNEVLQYDQITPYLRKYPRPIVVEIIRKSIDHVRQLIISEEGILNSQEIPEKIIEGVHSRITIRHAQRLQPVINATGVIISTNLGRSIFSPEAQAALQEVAANYSNLEYELIAGERGSRQQNIQKLLCDLSGSEAAMVVNNNAAAVALALNTLALDKDVIISRGEMVEIGGSFRIFDIMKRTGARIVEVGATNKTRPSDYEEAITDSTALILKIHQSNFSMVGYTSLTSIFELSELGLKYNVPVMHDLGSGAFIDFTQYGLERELTIPESIQAGVSLATASGDKLLGGPQAGIIVGKEDYIQQIKRNPLARTVRVDKLTLAALEATLQLFFDEEVAIKQIPTLRMMLESQERIKKRARKLATKLSNIIGENAEVKLINDYSEVGGGSMCLQKLPTTLVAIKPSLALNWENPIHLLHESLRLCSPPIISRLLRGWLTFDLRTVKPEEENIIVNSLATIMNKT